MIDILSADIGGTNSRFAHFQYPENGELALVKSRWLKTGEQASFDGLLESLEKSDFPLRPGEANAVVIAIAGPVEEETRSAPPYIPWEVDLSRSKYLKGLKRKFLINDFVAQAFACRTPAVSSAREILSGTLDGKAPLGVIGAGTALGQAALVPLEDGGYVAVPSEGGHGSFPFQSEEEFEYGRFLLGKGHPYPVIANIVVSGRGLSLLHEFLTGQALSPAEVPRRFDESPRTLQWMARFYGRVCRNYALQILAAGGIYVAGGVAAKTPELLTHREFGEEFRRSETMGHLLKEIPVFLNADEESGLWGAASMGLHELRKRGLLKEVLL